jgi:hypothetical protein
LLKMSSTPQYSSTSVYLSRRFHSNFPAFFFMPLWQCWDCRVYIKGFSTDLEMQLGKLAQYIKALIEERQTIFFFQLFFCFLGIFLEVLGLELRALCLLSRFCHLSHVHSPQNHFCNYITFQVLMLGASIYRHLITLRRNIIISS